QHSYTEATDHRMVELKELKQKCEKSSREIEVQAKKLQKLQDTVVATKSHMAARLREQEEQSRLLQEQKEQALQQLQELRNEVTRVVARTKSDLATLSCQSGATLKVLLQVVEKAQRILRLAEMCRRLETEEEKVLPFYPSSLAEEELQDARKILEETPVEPLARVRRHQRDPG
ncbi:DRC2 protein, partial [Smithornis capensis]|nr:DRC2 protein [Smithornis capensis]